MIKLRRAGFIVGIITACLLVLFLILSINGMLRGDLFGILFYVVIPGVLLFGSLIVALKWTFIGGILVISEGLFLTVLTLKTQLVLFGLLLLASGYLFILSWRVRHKLLNKEQKE